MAKKVTHFMKDGQILCGTKAKTPVTSEVFAEVTCKKCLKKMVTTTGGVKSVEDKKHGYCLETRYGNLIKLGTSLESAIDSISILSSAGQTVTSMRFANTRGMMDKKEESFFRNYFEQKKSNLGRAPLVSEVYADFDWL